MPQASSLRVPQARVLKALTELENGSFTRASLAKCAGYTRTSGTVTGALRGVTKGRRGRTPHPGLLELGYVIRTELDIDGPREVHYKITEKGIEAVTLYLNEKELPNVRQAKKKN